MSSGIDTNQSVLEASSHELEVLRLVLDRAPLGVLVYRPDDRGRDFKFVYTNPTAEAMKPFRRMLGHTFGEVWPEIAEIALPRFREVLETGEPWVERDLPLAVEISPGTVSTRHYTYEVSRTRVYGEDFLIGLVSDVTQEVQTRQALSESLTVERVRSARLQTLAEVDELATSSLDAAEVIEGALQAAERHLGVLTASVWTLDPESERLSLVGARGFPRAFFEDFAEGLDLQEPFPVARATRQGSPLLLERIGPDLHRPVAEAYARYGIELQSLAAVPLIAKGKAIGGLTLAWKDERRFGGQDVAFITTLAGRFSDSIENARLFQEQAEQAEYAQALNRINAIVHGTLDAEEVLRRVVAEMSDLLEIDASMTQLKRDGHWEVAYGRGIPEELHSRRLSAKESELSVFIEKTRKPVVIPDVTGDERTGGNVAVWAGIHSLIGLPVTIRDRVVGVLFGGWKGSGRRFSPREIDFAQKVASTVSLALENAWLYEGQLQVASRLQEALLAVPDAVVGVEFAHAYRSATEVARVGGDFYDIFDLSDDRVGIMIGDVAGKGLDAAVLTSLVKYTIRAHAAEKGKSPSQILELTNDVVYEATPAEAFVTVFLAFLDRSDGSMVFANAGHTTGAVLKADRSLLKLSATGAVLGAFPHIQFAQIDERLDRGDLLFLYTDGLIEARRDGSFYSEERLFRLLSDTEEDAPSRIVKEVIADVLAFSGGDLSDDVAIVVLKRLRDGSDMPASQKVEL